MKGPQILQKKEVGLEDGKKALQVNQIELAKRDNQQIDRDGFEDEIKVHQENLKKKK